jgi:hypothetical protein
VNKIKLVNYLVIALTATALCSCGWVRATGDSVEAVGDGAAHAVEETGDAVSRAADETEDTVDDATS